jgi:hypothetical protein
MDEKLKLLPYFLLFFSHLWKIEKVAKMDEKLRIYNHFLSRESWGVDVYFFANNRN